MKKLSVLVETVKRFPAASLLAFANAGFVAWAFWSSSSDYPFDWTSDNVPLMGLYASALTIILAAVVTLLCERWVARKSLRLLAQGGLLVVFAVLFAVFLNGRFFEERFYCSYYGTLLAFAALVPVALRWTQRERDLFATLFCAVAIAFAAAFCVGAGFSIVLTTVDLLFPVDIPYRVYATVWWAAFAAIGTNFLIAYSTRREVFSFPKAFRVLLVYVVFPIFLILLGVLWVYLAKCVISWRFPNGRINGLVTMAASGWMILHLLLGAVEGGAAVRLFRRFGALLILPLSALQASALAIRLADYGLTPSRYLSCLFVAFTVLWAVAILVWHSRSELVGYLLFAALALFAALSPWNLIDVGVGAQVARLEAFAQRRAAGEPFSEKDRERIMGSWEFVQKYALENGHYRRRVSSCEYGTCAETKASFESEWGFKYLPDWERRAAKEKAAEGKRSQRFYFDLSSSKEIDVQGVASLSSWRVDDQEGRLILKGKVKGATIDVTDAFLAALQSWEEVEDDKTLNGLLVPLEDSRRVLFVSGSAEVETTANATNVVSAYGTCLLLK